MEAVSLTIVESSPAPPEYWEQVWQRCDYATFFHSPEWATIWQDCSGGASAPQARRVRFSDGREALLPFSLERRAAGLLNRLSSSGQATYGGWIASDALTRDHARLLLKHMLSLGKSLVWRVNPYDPLALQAATDLQLQCRADETHTVRMVGTAEQMLRGFKKGCREDIRKAQKRGDLSVSRAVSLDEWHAYHRVYVDSLRRWGHSPNQGYGESLFERLARSDTGNVVLWVTRLGGAIVSGELVVYAKRHAVSWHAATLEESLRSGVAKFQTYEIIRDCVDRNLEHLDFNPSAGLGGVRALKESFRPRVLPAPLVYVDSPLKRGVRAVCSRLNIGYAKLDLVPAASLAASPELAMSSGAAA